MRRATCHPYRKHKARGLCSICYMQDYYLRNVEERAVKRRELYQRNKERELIYSKKWYEKNRQNRREYKLQSRYGLDDETHKKLWIAQGKACPICGVSIKRYKAQVDHDHATGEVRGLLCGACNRGLGQLEDKTANVKAALTYICNPPALKMKKSSGSGIGQKGKLSQLAGGLPSP